MLSRVDLWKELLEELEASSEPEQSLCGRIANHGDVVLDFVQHDGLERGKAVRIRHQLLVNFLHGEETWWNVAWKFKYPASKRSVKAWRRLVFMLWELDLSRKSRHTLIFPTKSILTGANTVDPSLSEERKSLIISSFSFNQRVMSSWPEHFQHVCWR